MQWYRDNRAWWEPLKDRRRARAHPDGLSDALADYRVARPARLRSAAWRLPATRRPWCRATDRRDGDITDSAAVDALVADFAPDVVINAAAYTAVDQAESDEAAAYLVNATGPALLAAAVARHGGRLIHVSTDYVFAGDASVPYEVDDPTGAEVGLRADQAGR